MAEEEKLRIHTFNPKILEEKRIDKNAGPATILLIGSKRTGKTTIMKNLLYVCRKIPYGLMIIGSVGTAEEFGEYFPKSCIFNKLDASMNRRIENIIVNQQKCRKKNKELKTYSNLLLMDDCGYDKKFFTNNPTLSKLFMNGRHYNMLNIISLQYMKSVPPELRANADYVFILREPMIQVRRKLYEEFSGNIPDFQMFCKIMDQLTDDYGCMVIDKTKNSTKIEDNVYHFKAKYPLPKFRAGCKKLWEKHDMYYKSGSDSEDEKVKKKSTKKDK